MGAVCDGALPTTIVLGAMKAGTSAVHEYLAAHPEIAMSQPKELNFFFGPSTAPRGDRPCWLQGNWHRGTQWYASQFSPTHRIRGESSPGYTSPGRRDVAERMHRLVPRARLIYLVRHPLERALSQYRHHRRDGTEARPVGEALLDRGSQYIARSRYYENLRPFLALYPRQQIAVVAAEELAAEPRRVLRALFGFVEADAGFWDDDLLRRRHEGGGDPPIASPAVGRLFVDAVRDDVAALQELAGRDLRWGL